MQTDDELAEHDRAWLAEHQSDLWAVAQRGYAEHSRGTVLVSFEGSGRGQTEITYTDRPNLPSLEVTTQVAHYNPATQMVVVCQGQRDNAEVVLAPRAYLIQYLTPAA